MSFTLNTWPTKHGLRIGYLNINSARNKKDDIASILHNNGNQFHLFCFAESRLSFSITDADMNMPGYQLYRLDPHKPKRTGLVTYFANSLNCRFLNNFDNYDIESIWMEIKMKGTRPLLIGFIYRNPSETTEWTDKFDSLMDEVISLNHETIIFGDFNIDLLQPKPKWHHNYTMYGLQQLVDKPTRVTDSSSTLIDHIYTNTKAHVAEVCVPPCGCSDHDPICITWYKKRIKIPKVGHKTIYYRSFKTFNEREFLSDLANSQLNLIYQIRDPNEAVEFWISTFISVYDKHAPFIKKRVREEIKPPWITPEIDREIALRNHLKINGTREQYNKQRNKVNSMKRKSKQNYFKKLLISTTDSRMIWKAINLLNNKHVSKSQKNIKDIFQTLLIKS